LKTRTGIEVYRQADAARRLKVKRQRVGQLINEGKLHTVDEDGFRLVTALSLREVMQELNPVVKVAK
jgi:predicted XRE-type DNA-binding protein